MKDRVALRGGMAESSSHRESINEQADTSATENRGSGDLWDWCACNVSNAVGAVLTPIAPVATDGENGSWGVVTSGTYQP